MIWTHVSDLAIDRLLAGEVASSDAAAIRDHAAGCTRCGALLDDALAVQRTFAADPPPLGLPVPLRHRRSVVATVGALAAALALVAAWPRSDGDVVRTKGAALVGFFVAHGDQVRRGATREVVAAGDRIELFTTTVEAGWFAAYSDDAAGARSVYVEPRPIGPGHERVLPMSIELDATLGVETVTGVFCAERFDPRAPPPSCTLDRFTLVKVAR